MRLNFENYILLEIYFCGLGQKNGAVTLQNIKKTVMVDTVRKRFGLLGRNISYSFSKGYFTDKFNSENFAGCTYENFDIPKLMPLRVIKTLRI
jgi:hypothetical protein